MERSHPCSAELWRTGENGLGCQNSGPRDTRCHLGHGGITGPEHRQGLHGRRTSCAGCHGPLVNHGEAEHETVLARFTVTGELTPLK